MICTRATWSLQLSLTIRRQHSDGTDQSRPRYLRCPLSLLFAVMCLTMINSKIRRVDGVSTSC